MKAEAQKSKPTLAVSMGDPGGVGPEVVVKALADRSVREAARWRVLGVGSAMHEAAQQAGVEPFWWRVGADSELVDTTLAHDVTLVDYEPPDAPVRCPKSPSRLGGEFSFKFVEDAIAAARRPAGDALRVDGIVTGPISKEAWSLAGRGKYPGHTELLATRFGVKRHAMMFVSEQLRVVLATAHVPLMEIRNALTIGRVFDAIDLGHEACQRLGLSKPRIAVCGLNPHAGEGGLLGDEEERIIAPAIRIAQQHGIDARGPFPGDTVFRDAIPRPGSSGRAAKYDLVVAMYHDQGLIPVKLLFRDEAVNVTVGLPTIRTSPDHGTAFDIAGRGAADAGSTRAAMLLAVRLARSGAPGGVAAPRG